MIKQHRLFEHVPDETILWQYMSLTKFLFFIKKRKLHLHNIDDFMDKEEGVLSALDKRSLPFYKDTEKWNKYDMSKDSINAIVGRLIWGKCNSTRK